MTVLVKVGAFQEQDEASRRDQVKKHEIKLRRKRTYVCRGDPIRGSPGPEREACSRLLRESKRTPNAEPFSTLVCPWGIPCSPGVGSRGGHRPLCDATSNLPFGTPWTTHTDTRTGGFNVSFEGAVFADRLTQYTATLRRRGMR